MSGVVLETALPGLKLLRRGKVRDVYDAGEHYLIVATDRISAFDVVLPNGIPGKGTVLTRISIHWFRQVADIVENHLVATEVDDFPAPLRAHAAELEGRSMLVKKASVLPVECIVRGYLSGSGWKEYKTSGTVCGLALLLAPQSGKRTRQQIADLAEDLKDYATDLTDKVRTKVV